MTSLLKEEANLNTMQSETMQMIATSGELLLTIVNVSPLYILYYAAAVVVSQKVNALRY